MRRKKILWLVSWYPNKNDRFDGDFIQRHARAAAIYNDIHVIFVTDVEMEKPLLEEWYYATGLTEQIIYFKRRSGFIAKTRKQFAFKSTFQQAIKQYIKKNGLPDGVHVHVPWKSGLLALWMKKKFKVAFIITEHFGIYNNQVQDNFFTKHLFVQNLTKKIFKEAIALTAVSKFLATEMENVVGRKSDFIIPNVVDTSLFFPKNEKYSKFTFVHVSNMAYWKNVEKIIDAFSRILNESEQEVQLILIGNRNNQFVDLAQKSGLLNKSIFFKGEIPYNYVAEDIRRAHCHVLFGNFETFSCVTAESLCCGLPVIVPNAGAVTEMVNEYNGIIVPKDDINELANAMREMIKTYDRLNHQLIAQEAAKKFSYSAVAEQFEKLYSQYC